MSKVKESSAYENLLNEKVSEVPNSVLDFMDLDEEERQAFDEAENQEWKKYWKGMPDYEQEKREVFKTLAVHFRNEEDFLAFKELVDQSNLTLKTKSTWYPALSRSDNSLLRWVEDDDPA